MRTERVFVDTSIQVARVVHGPDVQSQVTHRLSLAQHTMTGLVVRLEFKRRLLKEAKYLLDQFEHRKSFERVQRHVHDHLPPLQNRKQRISMQMLLTIDAADSDRDRTDRARLFLRDLLRFGLRDFDAGLHQVLDESHCAAGAAEVVESKPFQRYDFGFDRCDRTNGNCGISGFLAANRGVLERIRDYIRGLAEGRGGKTKELAATEEFINAYLVDENNVERRNPCTVVGDLLVALESIPAECFYTMNWKESKHLCRVLGQDLAVRPANGDRPDTEFPTGNDWNALIEH